MNEITTKWLQKTALVAGILFFVAGLSIVVSSVANATGNGIEVLSPIAADQLTGNDGEQWGIFMHQEPVIQLFVNEPVHNAPAGTYEKNNVPVAFRVDWAACMNKLAVARVIVRYDKNGGHHSNLTGTANSNWEQLYNNTFSEMCGNGYMCIPTRSFSGRFDLSDLKQGACDTTIQFVAKWNWQACGTTGDPTPNSTIDAGDALFAKRQVQVINTWLNFSCPTPTPTPTPTATPTPTNKVDVVTEQKIVVVVEQKKEDKNNVEISKTDNRETIKQGETSTYKITVKNNRDNDITNATITDRLPLYLSPIAAKPDAKADAKSRTITWKNQTISANAEVTYAIKVRVADDAPKGYLLQNVVTINGDGLRGTAVDTTLIEGVAVITTPQPVPVTAKTGLPFDTITMLLSFSGSIATAGTLMVKKLIK